MDFDIRNFVLSAPKITPDPVRICGIADEIYSAINKKLLDSGINVTEIELEQDYVCSKSFIIKTTVGCTLKDFFHFSRMYHYDEFERLSTDLSLFCNRQYTINYIADEYVRILSHDLRKHVMHKEDMLDMARFTPIISSIFMQQDMTTVIKDVIFHDPATIVYWKDGSKTVVKCKENEDFDPEKGLAMAICKKIIGDNTGRYYKVFKKWVPKEEPLELPAVVNSPNFVYMDNQKVSLNGNPIEKNAVSETFFDDSEEENEGGF